MFKTTKRIASQNTEVQNTEQYKGFSLDEIESFRQAFSIFDREGRGSISSNDLSVVMRSLGQNPSAEEIKEMVEEVDSDGNDNIEFEEFLSMMEKKMQTIIPEHIIQEAFHTFDKDSDGYISLKELQGVMFRLGEVLPMFEIKKMMEEADIDKDGRLNYEEFAEMMR